MILGLTGFSGAGKSSVAAIFKEHGFYHLDCDDIVHNQVYRDPKVLQALAAAFGDDLLEDGVFNRIRLREKTMGNPAALKQLNTLVMPFILAAVQKDLDAHQAENIILDAPLLFESGLDQKCDRILSVIADPKQAAERIIKRDHLNPSEAEKRLASQHSADFYTEKSDYIITNNGNLPALENEILHLIQTIYDETL